MVDSNKIKVPPHDVAAEQSVIGGLMMSGQAGDGSAFERVAALISGDDFYRQDHKLIFNAMAWLAGENQPVDLVTLPARLTARDEMEKVGGFAYLGTMAKDTPSFANIEHYARIVRNLALRRRMIAHCREIIGKAFDNDPSDESVAELVEENVRGAFALEQSKAAADAGLQIIKPFIKQVIEDKQRSIEAFHKGEKVMRGIPTGIKTLDERWGGLEPGRVYTIAARPSMGKSAEALQISDFVAQYFREKDMASFVAIFSLEMPEHELVDRLIACSGRADYGKLREPWKLMEEDWIGVTGGVKRLGKADLYMDCSTSLKASQMRQRVRRVASETRQAPGLIVLDHLHLMSGEKKNYPNGNAEVEEITRDIKRLAKDLNVPIILLAQLNRGVEGRGNKRPVLSDLRESGSIEQDSDFVQFIYRESQYDPQCGHDDVELITAKARAAKLGTDLAVWKGNFQRFEERSFGGYEEGRQW